MELPSDWSHYILEFKYFHLKIYVFFKYFRLVTLVDLHGLPAYAPVSYPTEKLFEVSLWVILECFLEHIDHNR